QQACSASANIPRKHLRRTWGHITGSPLRWRAPRPPLSGEWPRLGRVLLNESDARWVNTSLATARLGAGQRVSLFGVGAIAQKMRAWQEQRDWILGAGSQPTDTFFALVDVLLLHGADPLCTEHIRHATEAAAAGCILLGDEAWRHVLIDDSLCCELAEVLEVSVRVRASAEAEGAYRRASAGFAVRRLDQKKFVEAVCPA